MEAAMPCKMGNEEASEQESAGNRRAKPEVQNKIQKTKHACIVEAHESTRKHFGIFSTKWWWWWWSHCGERVQVDKSQQFCAQSSFRCFKRWELQMRKPQWTKNGRSSNSCQRGTWTRWRVKKEVILGSTKRKIMSTLVHWWTFVIRRILELEAESTKSTKGRVVLREDIVKDDSGSYAVFTELVSSTSQMTAANVNGCHWQGYQDCAGQAADAVSAYTQVKMEDAPKLLKIAKVRVSTSFYDMMPKIMVWIRLPRHKWPKSWSCISKTRGCSWMKSAWSPNCRIVVGKTLEKVLLELGWEKVPSWNVYCSSETRNYFCQRMWMTLRWLERKQKHGFLCGRKWMKKCWYWTNPHHFLTMCTWDALSVNANQMKSFYTENSFRRCWVTNFGWSNLKSYQGGRNRTHTTVVWSYGMEGHAQKVCWKILWTGE